MIFSTTRQELVATFGEDRIRLVPREAAEAVGVGGETLRFLSEIGLPENEFISFAGVEGTSTALRKVPVQELGGTWDLPPSASDWIMLGNFEISAVVLDARSGEVHQLAEGIMRPIPLHGDVSSLVYTVCQLTRLVQGLPEDYDEDEEFLEELEGTVDALKRSIAAQDPRPFGHEYSEWVEIFTSIGAGTRG
jgi:hypothetical protein